MTEKQVRWLYESNRHPEVGFYCEITGERYTQTPHLCHAVPVNEKGGDSSMTNIFLGSPMANRWQDNKILFEWIIDPDGGRYWSTSERVKRLIKRLAEHKGCSIKELAKPYLTEKQLEDFCLIFETQKEVVQFPEWKEDELGIRMIDVKVIEKR
ncbi:hypothetical protein ACJROX_10900 [Pseudalkalibacillus sp. A8]|uniref:hypothetical protein n=1 Tax=Pseudalkalibacillus sp. A8 TaxID=3382641 RepID=UPI0038B67EA7